MKGTLQLLECVSSSFALPSAAFALPSAAFVHASASFSVPPYFSGSVLMLSVVGLLALLGASFVVACVVCAAWLHHRKGAGGALRLEGRVAEVLNPLEPEGAVMVGGELWRARARSGERIARGRVRIVGARGHWLEVEPE